MNKVSIIVPAYNAEQYIINCLDSLVNQTYKDIEIIIINDGSTDNTLNIIKDYEKKYKKIIKIIDQKNAGQGAARNRGIKEASGEYVTFVDSDDYVKFEMIEKLYNNLKENNSDVSVGNIIKKYEDKEILFNNFKIMDNDNVNNLIISHPGPVARLYKKSLFIDNNIYFLENLIYEDLGTIPLLGLYANNVSYINDYLYYYVIREGSTMNQIGYSEKLENIFDVMSHLEKKFNGKKKKELEYLYIEHLLRSACLRFSKFNEGKEKILYIKKIIKKKYPNWRKNKYYKNSSIKFKILCNLNISMNRKIIYLLSKFINS